MAKYITKFTIVAREYSYKTDSIVNEYFLTEKRNEHDLYWTKEELVTKYNPVRKFQTSREAVLTLYTLEPPLPWTENSLSVRIAVICDDCIIGYIPIANDLEV